MILNNQTKNDSAQKKCDNLMAKLKIKRNVLKKEWNNVAYFQDRVTFSKKFETNSSPTWHLSNGGAVVKDYIEIRNGGFFSWFKKIDLLLRN